MTASANANLITLLHCCFRPSYFVPLSTIAHLGILHAPILVAIQPSRPLPRPLFTCLHSFPFTIRISALPFLVNILVCLRRCCGIPSRVRNCPACATVDSIPPFAASIVDQGRCCTCRRLSGLCSPRRGIGPRGNSGSANDPNAEGYRCPL